MTKPLKPCPFCGRDADLMDGYVSCIDGHCAGYDVLRPINAWNARAKPAAPNVDVDALADEAAFKLLAEVHHDGYFSSHDNGKRFVSIIKAALLKAQSEV